MLDTGHHEFLPRDTEPLTEDIVPVATKELGDLNLVGGISEKYPTKFFGICSALRDQRLIKDMLGGTRFAIWGGGGNTH